MKRTLLSAVAIFAPCAGAYAADAPIYGDMRPAYPQAWEESQENPLRFESGVRYWYSWGEQDASFGGPYGDIDLNVRDQTHIGELYGKIDDLSTQTYVRAIAGLGVQTSGTYSITPSGSGNIGGQSSIGYAGGDFGWMPFGQMDGGFAIGGLVGYQYWKDAPDIGEGTYGTAFAGGVPTSFGAAKDNLDIHALRLGVKATADFEMFDFQAEVAAVPFAHVTGSLGGSGGKGYQFVGSPGPLPTIFERAPTTLSGTGHGVMAETMVGFHPTENLTLRVGGRAWYLEGELEANFKGTPAGVGNVDLTIPSKMAKVFRYGAFFELTGRF